MRVLVIGGTLFIGRGVVQELLKAGHDVTVMHRKPKHDLGRRVQNLMTFFCDRFDLWNSRMNEHLVYGIWRRNPVPGMER